jgi:hypothetical protein
MYFINQIVCYITFFFITIFASSGQTIIRMFIGINVRYVIDLVRYSSSALLFLAIIQSLKILNGFLHALLFCNSVLLIPMLTLSHIILLLTVIYFKASFRLKTMLTLVISEYMIRIIFHLMLILRVYCQTTNIELS